MNIDKTTTSAFAALILLMIDFAFFRWEGNTDVGLFNFCVALFLALIMYYAIVWLALCVIDGLASFIGDVRDLFKKR